MSHSYGEEYDTALALVGISGRFPDAQNVETFWQNILHGVKSIRTFSDEEVLASGVDPAVLKQPNYVKAGTILKDIALFDAAFFGYTPREAELMDPQHRLFLECSWEALEQAGYATESYQGLVGVFAGSGFCSYMVKNIVEYPHYKEIFGKLQIASGNERDSLASTVSYKMNLKGPSIAVQTFCSTSLVAVHLACQSLLNYDCDVALAGGVAITIPQEYGYLYEEGGILSPDGECRTFDARAQGSVMSDGVAVVALKRMEDALQDGDTIYALIRGSAVNNDGNVRANYTSPGLAGQSSVIAAALGTSEIDVETIGYIEAHGTGTSLGDSIELAAMIKAFASAEKKQYCAIGSVKPNIGHLDRASGVTGLIKAALALYNGVLPPSLNFERADSDIDLANSPFYVNTRLTPWKRGQGPRRAGVNSFGVGGTNAHVVLEEAPAPDYDVSSRSSQLLLLSAKTENALQAARAQLYEYLSAHPDVSLPDIAYTLQVARQAFNHRLMLVCSDRDEAIAQLASAGSGPDVQTAHQARRQRPVVYLLAGEEGLPLNGGKELYEQEPLFREEVDRCCELLTPLLGLDLRTHLLATSSGADAPLTQPRYRQPAAFVLLYALTRVLKSWGVEPAALLGDRVGSLVAATLAGVLDLSDALTLRAHQADMNSEGHADPAFSDEQQMDVMRSWFKGVKLSRPRLPYVSAATGTRMTAQEASDPDYWLRQMQQSDRLQQGIATLLETQHEMGEVVLLTPGARNACPVQPKQQERMVDQPGPVASGSSEMAVLLTTLGRLWLAGVPVDWQKLYEQESRKRVPLPTYPFERQHYWLEIPGSANSTQQQEPAPPVKKAEIAEWFYVPEWKQVMLQNAPGSRARAISPLLCFVEPDGFGAQLVASLQAQGAQVVCVYKAEYYWKQNEKTFSVRPGQPEDYELLLTELRNSGLLPRQILHAWTLASSSFHGRERERFEEMQRHGLYSLEALVRALGHHNHTGDVTLTVLTDRLYHVNEHEENDPTKATLLGACKVIAQEYSGIYTRCLDLPADGAETYLAMVQEELRQASNCPDIVFRDGQRWEQGFRAMQLPAVEEEHSALRQNGVYVLIGGLGKVGQLISEHLVRRVQARLVLIARSSLPVREQWESWLVEHEEDNEVSGRIRHIQKLEALGAEVDVYAASADNPEQVRHVLQRTVDRFGAIHGVIYVPAISDARAFGLMQMLPREAYESHFQAKVHGLSTLEQALMPYTLDFCLVFSSLSSILGGLGFLPYSAANAFIDAFVQRHNQQTSQPWRAVSWDSWQVRENPHGQLGGSIVEYTMTPEEGLEAFERVLQSPACYLINSTGDLNDRVRQWIYLENVRQQQTALPEALPSMSSGVRRNQAASPKPGALFGDGLEQLIVTIWRETLGIKNVSLQTNFFDLGGNSLIGLQVMGRLRQELQIQLSPVVLFEAPTVQELARYLRNVQAETETSAPLEETPAPIALSEAISTPPQAQRAFPVQSCPASLPLGERLQQRRRTRRQQVTGQEVAIVGMAGRFPGANTLEQFWQNLADGVESVTLFSLEELQAAGLPAELIQQPNYVRARPVLDEVAEFDAAFFGYSPQEATVMNPQHRLFLENCWQALEMAGYDAPTFPGLIGVFGGENNSEAYHMGIYTNFQMAQRISDAQRAIGNDKDSLTTTVSYKLNLKGPSYAVQTFCSTSLVAVHLACQSLRSGECDMALAGGVSVRVPTTMGYLYEEGGQESPDGHCRSFDAQARGTLFGDGIGVVVLKRLHEALEDGDSIYAVIKGSAINNDGALKVSYTAPSVAGQAQVVLAALQDAGVHAESIQYVEAHGTATALGDPIEVASLSKAYRQHTQQVGYCALGSVKSNIGHLDRAAGISGLLKVVLSLQHRRLPASLHYQQPNPAIDFAHSPFVVNTQHRAWPDPERAAVRRAAVNSLGMGGTNAHVIVEEAPEPLPGSPEKGSYLLPLSARTATALAAMGERLQGYLEGQGSQVKLGDVAYTLQVGRHAFVQRRVLLAEQASTALRKGEQAAGVWQIEGVAPEQEQRVVYLLGGMGEQYPGMGRELYEQEEVFRHWVDRGAELLEPLLAVDVRTLLYSEEQPSTPARLDLRALLHREAQTRSPQEELLQQTRYGQPVLFVLSYALAQQLQQWGIEPLALLGYSLGEYVAATLAGVWTWEEGLRLVARRAALIQEQPEGRMLAVPLSREQVQGYLGGGVWLAASGGRGLSVLAGAVEAIEQVQARLEQAQIVSRQVQARHAFHTPLLEPVCEGLRAEFKRVRLAAPQVPYISNVTGTWVTAEQATDAEYWLRQMCEPAHLGAGIEQVLGVEESVLLEVGMGQMLSGLLKQRREEQADREHVVIASQGSRYETGGARMQLLRAIGQLWVAGVPIQWERAYVRERRQRIALPTYPFEYSRYWIDPPTQFTQYIGNAVPAIDHRVDEVQRIEDLSDWFYIPSWKRSVPAQPFELETLNGDSPSNWLVFSDDCGIGQRLAEALRAYGQNIVTVVPGTAFAQQSDLCYKVRPDEYTDYEALLKSLKAQGFEPRKVAHCWSITGNEPPLEGQATLARVLQVGFHSLLAMTQALTAHGLDETQITVISTNMQSVLGNELCSPEKATLIGPCKVIPQEHPDMACRSVDICLPAPGEEEMLIQHLLGELTSESEDTFVALRGQQRWVQIVEPIRLSARPEQQAKNFRPRGVYLITGGLGGIGLAIAEYLAQSVQARLVLVGRTALPEAEQWPELLETLDPDDGLYRKLQSIRRLQALGSEVITCAADVADETAMQEVIQQTVATFGDIHGVIHAAAVPPSGLIQMKTPEMATAVLAPKVQGLLTLERVLRGQHLDFLILFSSMSSFTGGGPGQVDYCAANAFLDAYARCNATKYGKVIAIDWGEWQWDAWSEGLLGFPEVLQQYFRDVRKKFGITFEEGLEALNRILSRKLPQVVVSTQDFIDMVEGSKRFSTRTLIDAVRDKLQGHAASAPVQSKTILKVSDDPVEQKIGEIWSELLGAEQLSLHENFFALGGHSLMGLQLMSRLRTAFQVHLPLSILFEAPTIAELAIEIKLMLLDELEQLDDDEAEKLVEDQRERVAGTF